MSFLTKTISSARIILLPTVYLSMRKHGFSKFNPHTGNDWLCGFFIVSAKYCLIRNFNYLNWNGTSVGIIGMNGIDTPAARTAPDLIGLSSNPSYSHLLNFFVIYRMTFGESFPITANSSKNVIC